MQCPMCADFCAPSIQLILQHIGRVHAHQANFRLTCGVDDCQSVYTNFRRFREHLKKKHNLPSQRSSQTPRSCEDEDTEANGEPDTDVNQPPCGMWLCTLHVYVYMYV